ncbi:MAG: GMC family oxidoreductase, partial [Hyphomicrobiales bacterium]|nr:GMC family oxidoreductase [Hyphomicrobiales bacterium]
GERLVRSRDNWDVGRVFLDGAYQAKETWFDGAGRPFAPGLHYFVGGNSKVYGAALLRLRERDFGEVEHAGGVSPAWPLPYEAFAPHYLAAERLFSVHGARGEDPLDPACADPYPHPPVSHEPRIEALAEALKAQGLNPFHLPLGILLDEKDGKPTPASRCIRCDRFDGFPCPLDAKADAQVAALDPALRANPNVTLMTGAYVERIETDPSGRRATGVRLRRNGGEEFHEAKVVVAACGALSSALLFLRSANGKHPGGLANGSGQVGRNYMRHEQSALLALMREPVDATFQKTMAISDFYFAGDGRPHPLGLVQMLAAAQGDQVKAEALPGWLDFLPGAPFEAVARHALGFWLSSEDLPRPENRVSYDGDRVTLALTPVNMEAHRGLRAAFEGHMRRLGAKTSWLDRSLYFGKDVPIGGTAHQCGTMRFGADPAASVLDLDCRAHEVDNLYVADAAFFPSSGAVNPTLTIIANALRVADAVKDALRGAH